MIRQRTKDDREVEKIDNYSQKNVRIVYSFLCECVSLFVCVCVGFFVSWYINICRLFNANAILLEEQYWYYLTHSWKGVHTFPKGICPKVNVIARLEFELAYYDSAVHRFNHYTTRRPPCVCACACVCVLYLRIIVYRGISGFYYVCVWRYMRRVINLRLSPGCMRRDV